MGKIRSIILDAGFSFRVDRPPSPTGVISLFKSQLWLRSRILPPWSIAICLNQSRRAHIYSTDGPKCLFHDLSEPHLGQPAATQPSGCPRMSKLMPESHSESESSWSGHGPPLGPTSCRSSATWSRPSAILANLGPPRGHIGRRCPKSCTFLIQNHHCLRTRKTVEDSHSKSPWAFR